jgi:hypothetical protein
MEKITLAPPHSLTSSSVKDFWLLGGLSILVWAILLCLEPFKNSTELISSRFLQLPVLFAWLSLFCNTPHFLISYRFAYSRGNKFILQKWFPLIAVPLILISLFFIGYIFFLTDISHSPIIQSLNALILKTGLTYQLGNATYLGTELLAFTVRIMYITVGWHYSKQIFGCMMVYSKYTNYSFTERQRLLLKLSLFSVAFYNFFHLSIPSSSSAPPSYFFNIPLFTLGFSSVFVTFFQYTTLISFLAVCYFVFYKNYESTKAFVPLNIIVPYLAFHIWWIPPLAQSEFYFLMVPFFHSLQYLPFAYRLEVERGEKSEKASLVICLKLLFLFVIGLLAFEIIPTFLDNQFGSVSKLNTWYFMISFAVFINIHHFFIDSAIWKFNDPKVRARIFS